MRAILTAILVAVSIANAHAATTISMRIADRDGQSSIIHPGDFTLLSVGQTFSATPSGMSVIGHIVVTKRIDDASAKLASAASRQLHFETGRISMFGDSERLATLEFELYDVMIETFSTSVGVDGVPLETVAFSSYRMKLSYIPIVEGSSTPGKKTSIEFIARPASPAAAPRPPAVTAPSAAQKANVIAAPAPTPPAATTFNPAATSLMRPRSRSTNGTIMTAQVDGLLGFSTQPNHLGELNLTSFSWGASSSHAGMTASNASIAKNYDLATITLVLHALNRKPFQKAVVSFIKPGIPPTDYMKVTFTNPRVDSLHFTASEESGIGESIMLSYDALQIDHIVAGRKTTSTWGKTNVPKR